MELVYCSQEGLPLAREFGRKMWGDDAVVGSPCGFRSPERVKEILSGHATIKTFVGTIAEIDDEYDDVYVSVVAADGEEREFDMVGDASLWVLGRSLLARYVEISRLPSSEPLTSVMEIWIDTRRASS